MGELLSSTRLVDIVICIALVEAVGLVTFYRATGRGVEPSKFLPNLASGLALMVGLRCVLTEQPPEYVAACLAVSGISHGVGLWWIWRR